MLRSGITSDYLSEKSLEWWAKHQEQKEIYSKRTSEQFKELWKKEEFKQKMPVYIKQRCEFCNKLTSLSNYYKWHGKNCKHKNLLSVNEW